MPEPEAVAAALGGSPPAIEFRGVTKAFGSLVANEDVSFAVPKGTVHAIVGENGAGKTTLMNILFGLLAPDAGDVLVDGHSARISTPADAIRAGIGMVHQHFMLVDRLSTLRNVVLGAEDGLWLRGGTGRGRARVRQIQERYGLDLPLDALPRDLAVGTQQRVEIVKALYRQAETLILDEPTGVLTPQEVDRLFQVIRDLRAEGRTVVLITHKLREVLAVADNVTVLRGGRCVGTWPTTGLTRADLAERMVGRKVSRVDLPPAERSTEPRLRVRDLVVAGAGSGGVRGLSLDLYGGEILGVAGVAGNGQSELLLSLAGLLPVAEGEIRAEGLGIVPGAPADPVAARAAGLAGVPEDRHRQGMIGAWPARENAALGLHRSGNAGRMMHWRVLEERCRALMARHDVRPADPLRPLGLFSGGNQQKLVIGRALASDPRILLVGQPTRGVDVGAIESIHRELVAARAEGRAILLVSVELDEVMALSDRVIVMFEGRSMGELARAEFSEALLGLMMAGTSKAEALALLAERKVS